jgi:hypothetical protein
MRKNPRGSGKEFLADVLALSENPCANERRRRRRDATRCDLARAPTHMQESPRREPDDRAERGPAGDAAGGAMHVGAATVER